MGYSEKGGRLVRRAKARPQRPELVMVSRALRRIYWMKDCRNSCIKKEVNIHLCPRELALGLAEATTLAKMSKEAVPVNLQLKQDVGVGVEDVSAEELLCDGFRGTGIWRHS